MAIIHPSQPTGGKEIIHTALGRRMHPAGRVRSLRGAPHIGAALPIYRIGREDISTDTPIAKARKIGWGYPVIGGKVPGLALLHRVSGRLGLAGIVEGFFPRQFLKAALRAEETLHSSNVAFQPRLLEIPSLHVYALWLFAPKGNSRFVVISKSPATRRSRLHVESGIQAHIDAARAVAVNASRQKLRVKGAKSRRR